MERIKEIIIILTPKKQSFLPFMTGKQVRTVNSCEPPSQQAKPEKQQSPHCKSEN